MLLPYNHTNLLVASFLLQDAADLIENGGEASLKVVEILVERAARQLGK